MSQDQLKFCQVCGDVALFINFCAISCDSCRNFFSRNAKRYQELECKNSNESCIVNINNRRQCQLCRMNKCLAIGMRLERTKVRKSKNSQSINKQTISNNKQIDYETIDKSIAKNLETCFENDMNKITETNETIIFEQPIDLSMNPFKSYCFQWIQNLCAVFGPYAPKVLGYAQSNTQMFNMQEYLIRKVVNFGSSISGFADLSQNDQLIVLKSSFQEIILLRSMFYYESEVDSFPMRVDEDAQNALYVRLDLLYQAKLEHLYQLHIEFAQILRDDKDDDVVRDLLCVLIMFKSKDNITRPEHLRYEYSRYSFLLQRHLRQKYYLNDKNEETEYQVDSRYLAYMKIVENVTRLKNCYLEMYTQIEVNHSISYSLLEFYD